MITAQRMPGNAAPVAEIEPAPVPIGAAGLTRPAWIEIDVGRLHRNFAALRAGLPPAVGLAPVIKDNAYGHGAVLVARAAAAVGARFLAVNTLAEAEALCAAQLRPPVLLLGERALEELPVCLARGWRVCVGELAVARELNRLADRGGQRVPMHLKVDTGMGRFGVRWDELPAALEVLRGCTALELEGVASHFASADEAERSFARVQFQRFQEGLALLQADGWRPRFVHLCNSGGLLEMPDAHFNLVRPGILGLGVAPSAAVRRLPELAPVMAVKARLVAMRWLQAGDACGYGPRFIADSPRRLATVPVGYGDGFPRLCNAGHVLVHGRRAAICGAVSMDALSVDVTGIPEARLGDEAVLLGRSGGEEITAHDLARWKGTIVHDVLVAWRGRLPRVVVGHGEAA